MRIILFSTGNIEYLIELANALSKKREEVLLMLPSNYIDKRQVEAISDKVGYIPYTFVDYKSVRDNFKMALDLIRIFRKYNPDILHIQSNGHAWFPLIYPFLPSCKIINTIHDVSTHPGDNSSASDDNSLSKLFGKIFTDKYIVHGTFLKKEFIRIYKIKKNKIFVINHGNYDIYKKWHLKEMNEIKNTILFFGRIWKYKGLEYLIKTEPIVSKIIPDVKYIIAGRGEDFNKYNKYIQNPEAFIIKNKRIPLEEVGELFQTASVVVLPYIEASQSGVIPIAYAYSKPVIATKVGSLPEVVENGITGFLIDPGDEHSLAEKIILLLKDDGLRKQMGINANRYSNTSLSWDTIASETINVYLS